MDVLIQYPGDVPGECGLALSVLVAIATLRDEDRVVLDLVDQTVFVIDLTRPVAQEAVFERFGFADPFVAVAYHVRDECVDPLERLAVLNLPPEVVLSVPRSKGGLHSESAKSRTVPAPFSSSSMEARRRRAFAGLRSR